MKKLVLIVMLLMTSPVELCGQVSDTIYCRSQSYYYNYNGWYDSCFYFKHHPSGLDTTDRLNITASSTNELLFTKSHTDYPLDIYGLSCMLKKNPDECDIIPYSHASIGMDRLPEYLYVCYFDSVNQCFVPIDSVRWDTAAPKVLKLPKHADTLDGFCYCYVYEAMFPKPVRVNGDFWIEGTRWNNSPSNQNLYGLCYTYWTHYAILSYRREIQRYNLYYCPSHNILESYTGRSLNMVNLAYHTGPAFGPFFPIVNTKLVEVHSSAPEFGSAGTSGYYVDSTYCDIYARPEPSGRFLGWSDGSTDRNRHLFVTRDTVLTAYFEGRDTCYVSAETPNGHLGSVEGGGMYFDGDTVTLTAEPVRGFRFTHWNDGDTTNPREVVVTTDTSFTAYFEQLDSFWVRAWVNNEEWGEVTGTGLYYDGEEVRVAAFGKHGHRFLHWGDGSPVNIRRFMACDTLLEAYFEEYSGIEDVGSGENLFELEPNPARGSVTVSTGERAVCDYGCQMVMHDMSGREVKREALTGRRTTVNLEGLSAGIYFVIVVTRQGVATRKLAVE